MDEHLHPTVDGRNHRPEPQPVVDSIRENTEVPKPPYVTAGPAFPPYPTDDHKHGLSILDYFAAKIMGGLCARQDMTVDDLKAHGPQDAYWIAALMIDVRAKLPIEETPAPPPEPEEEEVLITATDARRHDIEVKLGRRLPVEL